MDNIVRNFRDRAALEIRIRFGTTFVTVLDNVGSQGSDTHYEFMDGTTDGTFRVTPSDTRIEQTVNVPVPSVDQTYSATSPNAQSGTAVAEAVAEGVQVGPRYITASNVPPLPQMLQASPDSEGNAVRYTMRVTNNTDADTPAFTQFRFNDIPITVQMTDNTVPAFGTRYYTCLLYTSPSPRDS